MILVVSSLNLKKRVLSGMKLSSVSVSIPVFLASLSVLSVSACYHNIFQ